MVVVMKGATRFSKARKYDVPFCYYKAERIGAILVLSVADGPLEATTPPDTRSPRSRASPRGRPLLPARVQHRRQQRPFPRRRRGFFPRLPGEEPAPRGGISYRRGRRAEEPVEARRVPGFDRYGRRVATAEPFSRGAVPFI